MYHLTGIQRQILISGCLYLGQMLVGISLSWPGPIFPKLQDLDQSPLPYNVTETQLSLIASLTYVGGIPGPYVIGWFSNVKGRKPCLIIGGIILSLAQVMLLLAKNLAMMYCARVLVGLGSGIIGVINVVYLGEIASTKIRGILLTILGVFTTTGGLLMFCVGPFSSYAVATSVGLACCILFTICAILLPETPIFYLLKDDEYNVRQILKKLGREDDIERIIASKKEYVNSKNRKDWLELITTRSNRKALFFLVIVNILQPCSGFLAVVAFSGSIFNIAGSSIRSDISMIIIGLCQLLGSSSAPFFVERNGRKILMSVSSCICSLSMLTLGFYFYFDHKGYSGINDIKWLPLVILILFFIGYDFGIGVIPTVLIGEMFTPNVRSRGSTVVMTISWFATFLMTMAYGAAAENYGVHVAFWAFSCFSMFTVFFTVFFVPETKGKSLLEIQEILSK